ncbi:MAG: hypothetical protein BWY31_02797 [Lentisphaerae bacterium ADurb.Bin242]|nr:MAG: hypothetical protein BWY31_02797 [Lentisphaerae bacterium ADurb.Bin242]
MKKIFLLAGTLCALASSGAAELKLLENSKTEYRIVVPDRPDTGNRFALKELQMFLKEAGGADFQAVPASKAPREKRIFLGLSEPALKILGGDPLQKLKDQDHCVKTVGNDLFLFGKGLHGDLFAVYDFLENVLGFRWYDARGGRKTPDCRTLKLGNLDRKNNFSVAYRSATGYWIYHRPAAHLFFLRNRQNINLALFLKREGVEVPEDDLTAAYPGSHTLPSYLPGQMDRNVYKPFPWLKNTDYSKTHPEFFGIDESGKRRFQAHHCLSNPALRRELTSLILENMKRNPDKRVFSISQHDSPGRFCYCPECVALEKKYGTPGGPLFDCLIELAPVVKEKYPENLISFLVYRKNQTQIPPDVKKLPDNLMGVFAPIDDNFAADWNHPSNRETCKDLKQWGKISKNLSVWYYPNPYTGDITPALGNVRRLVNDIRLMVDAGMTHSSFEHDVGVPNMIGFTELQSFLLLQLFKDSGQDAEKLIDEFMAFEYGAAAPVMRRYLNELEDARSKMTAGMTWDAAFNSYTYLTPDNLVRWDSCFHEMEKLLENDAARRFNMERVRINLDLPLLQQYRKVKQKFPGFKTTPAELAGRIRKTFRRTIADFYNKGFEMRSQTSLRSLEERLELALLRAEQEGKALPKELFGKLDPESVIQSVPRFVGGRMQKDPDAAWGMTAVFDNPEPPFPFVAAFYDTVHKKYTSNIGRVNGENLGPRGKYSFYKLGRVTVSEDSEIQIGSWKMKGNVGEAFKPGSFNRCDLYVSLKFQGPKFYKEDADKPNRVFCDRVVAVRID